MGRAFARRGKLAAAVLLGVVLMFCLAVWFALSGESSKVRTLPVSLARIEGDTLLVVIPVKKYPRMWLHPLTYGGRDEELIYFSGTDQVQITQRPRWRITFDEENVTYSVSPRPTNNQSVLIEVTLTEWMRFPPLSKFVRTNRYEWMRRF